MKRTGIGTLALVAALAGVAGVAGIAELGLPDIESPKAITRRQEKNAEKIAKAQAKRARKAAKRLRMNPEVLDA